MWQHHAELRETTGELGCLCQHGNNKCEKKFKCEVDGRNTADDWLQAGRLLFFFSFCGSCIEILYTLFQFYQPKNSPKVVQLSP